jgi:penicillin-binding protein-related factor A (putative recombinase)
MKENQFQKLIIRIIKDLNDPYHSRDDKVKIWYLNTNEKSVVGIQDLLICYQGQLVTFELKVSNKKIPKIKDLFKRKQIQEMEKLFKSGAHPYGIIYNNVLKNIFVFMFDFKNYSMEWNVGRLMELKIDPEKLYEEFAYYNEHGTTLLDVKEMISDLIKFSKV